MEKTFVAAIVALLNMAMETACNFVSKDIYSFSPGIAGKIELVNKAMQVVAYALFLILTIYNITSKAIDIEGMKQPSRLFSVAVRSVVVYVAIGAAWDITVTITAAGGWLTEIALKGSEMMLDGAWVPITAPNFGSSWWDSFKGSLFVAMTTLGMSWIVSILMFIIAFCVTVALCGNIILTVVGRYLKIYILGAISPLAIACFASDDTKQYGKNFFHTFVGYIIEGLVICLAIIVFAGYLENPIFVSTDIASLFGWIGDSAGELAYIFELIFDMLLFMGIIKGTDQIVHQIFA